MKFTNKLLMLSGIVIVLVFTGCSSMKSTDLLNLVIPANNYEKTEIAYGSHQRQKLDLYLPKKETSKTPIVFVYGGAWRDGEKEDFKFVAQALAGMGHPVVIPDYRLYPNVTFPTFIDDVADAIKHLEQNSAKTLGQPLNHVILMGHSSGAHTAALLVTDKQYLVKRQIKTNVSALIAMSGPYDLPLDDPEVTTVFKGASAQQAKPILNVNSKLPPILLMHGLDDKRVLPFHTQKFETALIKNGTKVTTHLYKGVNHTRIIGSLAAPLRFLNDSYSDTKNFLEKLN